MTDVVYTGGRLKLDPFQTVTAFDMPVPVAEPTLAPGSWWAIGYVSAETEYRLLLMVGNAVSETYRLPVEARISQSDMRASLAGTHPDNLYLLVRDVGDSSNQFLYHVDQDNCVDGEEIATFLAVNLFTDTPWTEDFEYEAIGGDHLTALYWTTRNQRNSSAESANYGRFDEDTLEPIASSTETLTGFARTSTAISSPFAHDFAEEALVTAHNGSTGATLWRSDVLSYAENTFIGDLAPAYDDSPKGVITIIRFGSGDDEGVLFMQDTNTRIRLYRNDQATTLFSVDPSGIADFRAATGFPAIYSTSTVTSKTDMGTAEIDLCDPDSDCTPVNAYSSIIVSHTLPGTLSGNFEIAGALGTLADTTESAASGTWSAVDVETEAACWQSSDGDICAGTGEARKDLIVAGDTVTFKFLSNKTNVNSGAVWDAGNATAILLLLRPK